MIEILQTYENKSKPYNKKFLYICIFGYKSIPYLFMCFQIYVCIYM